MKWIYLQSLVMNKEFKTQGELYTRLRSLKTKAPLCWWRGSREGEEKVTLQTRRATD